MRSLWGWAAILAAWAAAGCETPPTKYDEIHHERAVGEYGFKVVKVIDSSSFLIDWSGTGDPNNYVPIKLLGIDTPDAVGFKEIGGISSAAYLEKLVKDKFVKILIDTTGWYRPLLGPNERSMVELKTLYKTAGQIPAFVCLAEGYKREQSGELKESSVNRLMLESGLAMVDRQYGFRRSSDRELFLSYENFARSRRLGIWR